MSPSFLTNKLKVGVDVMLLIQYVKTITSMHSSSFRLFTNQHFYKYIYGITYIYFNKLTIFKSNRTDIYHLYCT